MATFFLLQAVSCFEFSGTFTRAVKGFTNKVDAQAEADYLDGALEPIHLNPHDESRQKEAYALMVQLDSDLELNDVCGALHYEVKELVLL